MNQPEISYYFSVGIVEFKICFSEEPEKNVIARNLLTVIYGSKAGLLIG